MISEYMKKRIQAFQYAFAGIYELWKKEPNTRIHMFFSVAVIIAAIIFKINAFEFCILILTIGFVWFAEAMNSAVERVVDLVTLDKKPLAKAAKDLAAGAVLISAISSVFIGLFIFLPKIFALIPLS